MKRWALGEEFSTIRFTMLMRVSLSLICSGGRNGRTIHSALATAVAPHPPPLCPRGSLQETGEGQLLWGSLQHPDFGLATFHPVNCFWTSTDVLMQMSRQCAGRPLDPH